MGQINSKYDLNREELQSLLVAVNSEFEKAENYGENVPEEVFATRKVGVKNIVSALVDSDFDKIKENIKHLNLSAHVNKSRVSGSEDFVVIPLFKSEECLLKIHIFPPSFTGVTLFHTHKYNVISAVIKGKIEEQIATKVEGDEYEIFQVDWSGQTETKHINTGETTNILTENRIHTNTVYTVPNSYFHEAVNESLTITICMFIQKGVKQATFLEKKGSYKGTGKDLNQIYEENKLEKYRVEGLEYLISNFE